MAEPRAQIIIGAENRAEGVLRQVRAQLGGLAGDAGLAQRAFGGLGAGIAASLTGAGLAAFFKTTADGLDRLNDVADVTGSTIENISALEDVGARTGAGIDVIEGALVKLNAQLKEADGKNGPSLALKQIGLDAEKLKQVDPAEALRQTAVALAGYADDGNKARLVQELFGKSVKEVGPFLKDLATQGKLNATVTAEQAREAEKFNQQIFALQKNATDFARELGGPVMSALNVFFSTLSGNDEAFTPLSEGAEALLVPLQAVSVLGANVAFVFKGLGREIGGIAAQGAALAEGNLAGVRAIRSELIADGERARRELDSLERRLLRIKDAANAPQDTSDALSRRLARGEGQRSVGDLAVPAKAAKQQQDDADAYLKSLQDQYLGMLDLTSVERALITIRADGFKGLTPEREKYILDQARINDETKREAELRKLANDILEEAAESERAFGEEGVRIFNATRTPLENLNSELARLNMLQQRGTIDWETYKRAVEAAQDQFTKTTEAGKEAISSLDEFTLQAARNIQDQLGTSLYDAATGNFKNIGDDFSKLLLRMASEAIAADLAKKLFGEVGKDGKGLTGGLLGELFGGGTGGAKSTGDFSRMDRGQSSGSQTAGYLGTLASFFSGFFAGGGYVPAGRWGIAGERGPEPIFGGRTGLTVQPSGGRAMQVSQTFVLQQPASRDTQLQLAAAAQRGLAGANRNL